MKLGEMLGFQIAALAIICIVTGLIGGLCWPYALNEWLTYLGKDTHVTFWQGFMIGALPPFGALSIPIALLTWIIMLFI